MKAITVEPKKPGTAKLMDIPETDLRDGLILVEAIAVGVCSTDVEIMGGKYGWAPPGQVHLILSQESLGQVIDPGTSTGFKKGDLIVGIVRQLDTVPCPNCAVGEWDMCRNGLHTERGIKEIHGFMPERWRIVPEYAIKIDPSLGILGVLLEPTTVITKALEQIGMISRCSFWEPNRIPVTGAGPIGLLAALSLKIWGVEEIHVLEGMESGSKPDLIRELGATYHSGNVSDIGFEPDAIVECTGEGPVIEACIQQLGPNGILCLTGVVHGGHRLKAGTADMAATAVLRNTVIDGSVNANKRQWYRAGQTLAKADKKWLSKLITHRENPEDFISALERKPEDIKVVIQFSEV
jgi:glucose 1-dehydrogenase